jgi:hypothetical protein
VPPRITHPLEPLLCMGSARGIRTPTPSRELDSRLLMRFPPAAKQGDAGRGGDLGQHLDMGNGHVPGGQRVTQCGMLDGHLGGVDEVVGLAMTDRRTVEIAKPPVEVASAGCVV